MLPSLFDFPHQVTCENEVMTSRDSLPRMPDPLHPFGNLRKAGQGSLRDVDLKTGVLFTFLRKRTTFQVLPVLRLVQYMGNPFNFSIYRKLYSFQVEKKASLHTYPLVSYLSLITERPQI